MRQHLLVPCPVHVDEVKVALVTAETPMLIQRKIPKKHGFADFSWSIAIPAVRMNPEACQGRGKPWRLAGLSHCWYYVAALPLGWRVDQLRPEGGGTDVSSVWCS